jgi:nicotinate-nucleotide adenylyltransferase
MRIAFFGGTFDPPHCGHIAIAEAAIDRLRLDRILMAPVAAQPLKKAVPISSFEDRLAMVRLAVHGDPRLIATDIDGPRSPRKPNYTLDTLIELRRTLTAGDTLFCLTGADSFFTLKQWYRAAELMLVCDFIVAGRPGFSLEMILPALPDGIHVQGWRREPEFISAGITGPHGRKSALYLLPDLKQDVSATEIRAALANGEELASVLAPEVVQYVREHHLYEPTAHDSIPPSSEIGG